MNNKRKLLPLHNNTNLCLRNLEIQITKTNLHIKNIVLIVIEQTTLSLLVSKNNEMTKINEMLMLDRNLLKNHLYSTFVLLLMTEQKKHDTRYRRRSTSRTNYYNKNTNSQNRYRSTSRDRFSYDKNTTPPQYTRSRYDNYKKDSRSYSSPYRFSYRYPYRHDSRHRYRSRSYSRDNNNFTRYTSSYRTPSRPRDSRYPRSRSQSNTRDKPKTIQSQHQTDPINFEVHMYHPTEMANAVTPTSWFYSLYIHTPPTHIQSDNPSRLEISFLLDSGASISVLNYPTYVSIAKLLKIEQNSSLNPSKTLTVANQTEVPILHYVFITLNTTIEDDSRQFTIPFAVADRKHNILGTLFFEEKKQNINIQDFTLQFKHQSTIYPNYTKFTSLLSKDYPSFSYIYRINSKPHHKINSFLRFHTLTFLLNSVQHLTF